MRYDDNGEQQLSQRIRHVSTQKLLNLSKNKKNLQKQTSYNDRPQNQEPQLTTTTKLPQIKSTILKQSQYQRYHSRQKSVVSSSRNIRSGSLMISSQSISKLANLRQVRNDSDEVKLSQRMIKLDGGKLNQIRSKKESIQIDGKFLLQTRARLKMSNHKKLPSIMVDQSKPPGTNLFIMKLSDLPFTTSTKQNPIEQINKNPMTQINKNPIEQINQKSIVQINKNESYEGDHQQHWRRQDDDNNKDQYEFRDQQPHIHSTSKNQQLLQEKMTENDSNQLGTIKPRVFYSFTQHQSLTNQSTNIPYNVLLHRTIRRYSSYNINQIYYQMLKHLLPIENYSYNHQIQNTNRKWFWGEGSWSLEYYDNLGDYVYQYIGLEEHLENHDWKQKLRTGKQLVTNKSFQKISCFAFDIQRNQYHPFRICSYYYDHDKQFYYFNGRFIVDNSLDKNNNATHKISEQQYFTIHRIRICFSFEDPLLYINRLSLAYKQRQAYQNRLKYNFIVENMQQDITQRLPSQLIRNIKAKILPLSLLQSQTINKEELITLEDQGVLNSIYRGVNNGCLMKAVIETQQLMRDQKQQQNQCISLMIPFRVSPLFSSTSIKKPNQPMDICPALLVKVSGLGGYVKVHRRRFSQRVKQFESKSIYNEQWLCRLITKLKLIVKQICQNDNNISREKKLIKMKMYDVTKMKMCDVRYLLMRKVGHEQIKQGEQFLQQKSSSQVQQKQRSLISKYYHHREVLDRPKPPKLQQFLTINILSKFQNYLTYEIDNRIIKRVVNELQATIDKFNARQLFCTNSNDSNDNNDDPIYSLTLETFYETKLSKPVRMIEEVIRQQLRMMVNIEFESLARLIRKERQREMVTLQLRINNTNFNNQKLLLNSNTSRSTLTKKTHYLSQYIQTSLAKTSIIDNFSKLFYSIFKTINSSIRGVEKMLALNKHVKKVLKVGVMDSNEKWLRVCGKEEIPLEDIKSFIVERVDNIVRMKQHQHQSPLFERNRCPQQQNESTRMYLSALQPIISSIIFPLIQEIQQITTSLTYALPSNQQQQQYNQQKSKNNQQPGLSRLKRLRLLLDLMVYVNRFSINRSEVISSFQNEAIVGSILKTASQLNIFTVLQPAQQSLLPIATTNFRDPIKTSSSPTILECESIWRDIQQKQQILQIIQSLFGVNKQLDHSQPLSTSTNIIAESLLPSHSAQSMCGLIYIDTMPVYYRLSQSLKAQIQGLKNSLIDKFEFQTKCVSSYLQEIQAQLQKVPRTALQLMDKYKFISSLSSNSSINNSLLGIQSPLPILQSLFNLCLIHNIKLPKQPLHIYYQTSIKHHFIISKLIPQKLADCLMKKQLIHKQIVVELRTLDDVHLQFIRNVDYLKQETLEVVYKVWELKKTNFRTTTQQQSTICNDSSYDISMPDQLRTFHYFSIAQTVHSNYISIINLCQNIQYKQALFNQSFTNQQALITNDTLFFNQPVNSTKRYLPHSPRSLQDVYIEFYQFWGCFNRWNMLVGELYTNQLHLITLENPQSQVSTLLEKIQQTKKIFIQHLEDRINYDTYQNNFRSTFSIIFNDNQQCENQSILLQVSKHFMSHGPQQQSLIMYRQAVAIEFLDELIKRIKWFIQEPLKLLKILKKEGFTKKHLEAIGIKINHHTLDTLSLKQAITSGFIQQMDLIEAVSNQAWFSYHLQNTLQRIFGNLSKLKFKFQSTIDHNGSQVLHVTNYSFLNEQIDQILINLQTIHKNPAKQQFEVRLKNMHKDSLYISKCLEILEVFQAKFLLIHPIFQSPEIVKQLPVVNQKFVKVYRPWLEVVTFMRRMQSVLDVCNSLNIYQKVTSLITKLETIQGELSSYLEKKRRSYSRFFFLSDNEMFELFSKTKNLKNESQLIRKLMPSVDNLLVNKEEQILGVLFGGNGEVSLCLHKTFSIKEKNVEVWLNDLERALSQTVFMKTQLLFMRQLQQKKSTKVKDFSNLIHESCSQSVILMQQIRTYTDISMISGFKQLQKLTQQTKWALNNLINLRKTLQSDDQGQSGEYSLLSELTISALFILNSHKLELLQRIKKLKLEIWTKQGRNSYEYCRISKFIPKLQDNQLSAVQIQSFNSKFQYGFEFVGMYEKLVMTDLGDRVMVMYLEAYCNQQGNGLIGPAATGKSETVKDIANQFGKNCFVYNCSKSFQLQTLIRILKGAISSGSWISFDQFNLLDYSAMAVIAQNLYVLFKYRAYGNDTPITFEGDNLLSKPTFHISLTYNPNYEGRQSIPSMIKNIFRTVAFVSLDVQKICTISLLLHGFGNISHSASKKLIKIFAQGKNQWSTHTYDFGLRNLLNVVELAAKILQKAKSNTKKILINTQQRSMVESLIRINISKMSNAHRALFMDWINEQFGNSMESISSDKTQKSSKQDQITQTQQKITSSIQSLKQLFVVRNGVIIYGKPLSGKGYMIDKFLSINNSKHMSQKIFVNVLTLKQLYGEMDHSLNIWKDGVLTRAVKKAIDSLSKQQNKEKSYFIILKGHLHYEWIESLNTVLDNSRKLNLASGESINIPANVKFIFEAQNITQITPATLSRNGILFMNRYEQREIMSILLANNPAIKLNETIKNEIEKIKKLYHKVIDEKVLSCSIKYHVDKIFPLFWILTFMLKNPLSISFIKFIFLFFVFCQGFISESGKETLIFELSNTHQFTKYIQLGGQKAKKTVQNPQSSVEKYQDEERKMIKILKKIMFYQEKIDQKQSFQYEIENERKIQIYHKDEQVINSYRIFVKTEQYRKVEAFWKLFVGNKTQNSKNDIIVIFGTPGSGKSSIIKSLCYGQKEISNELSAFHKIFLTNSSKISKLYSSIDGILYKKSSHKLGALPGDRLVIQIEDLNLSAKNHHKSNNLCTNHELLRMIVRDNEWYNLKSLEKQTIQDLIILGDWKVSTKKIEINDTMWTSMFPVFLPQLQDEQVGSIFRTLISCYLTNHSKLFQNNNPTFISELKSSTVDIIQHILCDRITNLYRQSSNMLFPDKKKRSSNGSRFQGIFMGDMYRILRAVFEWRVQIDNEKQEVDDKRIIKLLEQLLAYETIRLCESKITQTDHNNINFKFIMAKIYQNIPQLRFGENSPSPLLIIPKRFLSKQSHQQNTHRLQPYKITSINDFVNQVECIVDQYSAEMGVKNGGNILVVFKEFCVLLVKILRAFMSPKSNLLFMTFPASGKRTLLKISAYMLKGSLVEYQQNYRRQVWLSSIREASKECFRQRKPIIFCVAEQLLQFSEVSEDLSQYLHTYYLKQAYSQADFEELIYMLQSFLIKNNLEVNRENCKYFFIENLKRSFHFVLNLYPNTRHTLKLINDYPAFLRYCEILALTEWPKQALILATDKYLIQDRLDDNDVQAQQKYEEKLRMFVEIHTKCKQISMKTKFNVWDGQYFAFMQTYQEQLKYSKHVLNLQKANFLKGLTIVKSTQLQIEKIKNEIKKLQPAIIQLEKDTQRSVKAIHIQKGSLQQFDHQLSLKNTQCKEIIEKSQTIKGELDAKNTEVNDKLSKIWKNVELIKQTHISQIKSLNNPSEFIKIVLTALVIIFHTGPIIKQKDEKGMGMEENYFETAKKYVLSEDAQTLANMLTGFDKDTIQREAVMKIQQRCMIHKKWNQKQARSANKAVYYFFLWVQAIVRYFHIREDTQPLRRQLQEITTLIFTKTKQVDQIRTQRQRIDRKVKQLIGQLEQKRSKLAEYSSIVSSYGKTIARGEEILRQIHGEKAKWEEYIAQIDGELDRLHANCLMRGVLIVYGAVQDFQSRERIRQSVTQILSNHSLQHGATYWQLKPMRHQQIFKTLDISSNHHIIDNLMIMESSRKPITLIDPEQQGLRYLFELNSYTKRLVVIKVNQHSPLLRSKIEEALIEKRLLLIEVATTMEGSQVHLQGSEQQKEQQNNKNLIKMLLKLQYQQQLPSTLQEYESPDDTKFNFYLNTNQILTKKPYNFSLTNNTNSPPQTSVSQLHSQFNCFFYTRSKIIDSIQLLTKTQVINFGLTQMQLQYRIKKLLVSCEFPDVQLQIDQTTKFSTKSKVQLQEIQFKILEMFVGNQAADLIETQETIQVLTSSNRLYLQINTKMNQAQDKKIKLMLYEKKFQNDAKTYANVYFIIKKLLLLSKSSAFSFTWFQRLIITYPKSVIDMVVKQVRSSLQTRYKVIVEALIGSTVYQKLNWDLIFGKNGEIKTERVLDRETIDIISKKLQIKETKVKQIYEKIKILANEIHDLQDVFKEKPRKFRHLIGNQHDKKDIFQCLPDQFSQIDLFKKILLISCFRPEGQILGLLEVWLKTNFNEFYTLSSQNFSPLSTHYKLQPIILIFDKQVVPLEKWKYIDEVERKFSTSQRSAVSISMGKSDLQKLSLTLKSAMDNNQWLIIEGIVASLQRITWRIIEFFQEYESDIRKHDEFKVLVIVDNFQSQLLPEHFTKFCKKIRVQLKSSIEDKIAQAYFKFCQSEKLKAFEDTQRNQRKYMLSQMCIFHYFIIQKTNYGQKLWNQINVTIEDYQLQYMVQYILDLGRDPIELRELIPKIAMEFVYGCKLADEQDKLMVERNIRDMMSVTAIERGMFWQSLWADDKFPKSIQQYKQYIKQQIANTRLFFIQGPSQLSMNDFKSQSFHQLFGISSSFGKQERLQMFTKLKQVYYSNSSDVDIGGSNQGSYQVVEKAREKMSKLQRLLQMAVGDFNTLRISLKSRSYQSQNYYNRLRKHLNFEKHAYIELYNNMKTWIQINSQKLLTEQSDYTFYKEVVENKIPLQWCIHSKMALEDFLIDFLFRLKQFAGFVKQVDDQPILSIQRNQQNQTIQLEKQKAEPQNVCYPLRTSTNIYSLFQLLNSTSKSKNQQVSHSNKPNFSFVNNQKLKTQNNIFCLHVDILHNILKNSLQTQFLNSSFKEKSFVIEGIKVKVLLKFEDFNTYNCDLINTQVNVTEPRQLKVFRVFDYKMQNDQESLTLPLQNSRNECKLRSVQNQQFYFLEVTQEKTGTQNDKIYTWNELKLKFTELIFASNEKTQKKKLKTETLANLKSTLSKYEWHEIVLSQYPLHYSIQPPSYIFVKTLFIQLEEKLKKDQIDKQLMPQVQKKRVHIFINH